MRIRLSTLALFLVGDKDAIQSLAGDRSTLLVGFALCFSAALARHYDGAYLVRQPWFLLAPAGASSVTSILLFSAMYLVWSIQARRLLSGSGPAYLTFLGLYWLTAPLAWFYAIPYERFLGEFAAAQANIWTLEAVSVWRVVLTSRVLAVLIPTSFFSSFSKLGTFALTLVYIGLMFARLPLVEFMGGVSLPPSAQPVSNAVLAISFYGFFFILGGSVVVLLSLIPARPRLSLDGFTKTRKGEVDRSVWSLTLAVILVFVAVLPFTQREQWLRYQVETKYTKGDIHGALAVLIEHQRNEFPPQWTPPPWPEYEDGARDPKLVDVIQEIQSRPDMPGWIRSIYREKAEMYLVNGRQRENSIVKTFLYGAPEGQ